MSIEAPPLGTQLGQDPVDIDKPSSDDITLWSVTTIIGCLDKPALLYWAAEETAKAAVSVAGSLAARIDEDGEEETVKWLRDARFRRPKDRLSAASLGTVTHALCESYALDGVRPDRDRAATEVRKEGGAKMPAAAVKAEAAVAMSMLDRFDEFLSDWQPAYDATEVTVYSPTYGYAGTADAFLTLDGVPLIADYKTSRESYDARGKPKTPYPETGLQLAAYRYAEMAAVWRPRRYESFRRRYYVLSGAEQDQAVAVPEVDGGVVIHLSPERYGLYPMRCDEAVHQAFLFVQEAARYSFEMSKQIVGAEMAPSTRAVA